MGSPPGCAKEAFSFKLRHFCFSSAGKSEFGNMKTIRNLPERFFSSIKAYLWGSVDVAAPPAAAEKTRPRGEGLARLHEYQHQVIQGLFRINIAGLVAFCLILISFTMFTFSDPRAPGWISLMIGAVGCLVLVGCYRTVKEFCVYRKNYGELMDQLQSRVRHYLHRATGDKGSTPEPRVLSVLKPKEHRGWDAKVCGKCQKSIELLAAVCQHCGHEQGDTLTN